MFDYFNKPALDDAINAGKEIRFSHNPEAYGECALKWEWDYLQEKHGYFALEKKEIFGMQQNNFNDIRIDTGKKIKKIFGNKIRGIEYYDVVEEAGHWSFKIGFFAYDYFYVVFTYELDIIGFSIEVGNGRLISVMNTHNCYSNTDMEAYIQRIVEELELRIPDKYLKHEVGYNFKFFSRLLISVCFLQISCPKSAFLSSYIEKVLSWLKKTSSQKS